MGLGFENNHLALPQGLVFMPTNNKSLLTAFFYYQDTYKGEKN